MLIVDRWIETIRISGYRVTPLSLSLSPPLSHSLEIHGKCKTAIRRSAIIYSRPHRVHLPFVSKRKSPLICAMRLRRRESVAGTNYILHSCAIAMCIMHSRDTFAAPAKRIKHAPAEIVEMTFTALSDTSASEPIACMASS